MIPISTEPKNYIALLLKEAEVGYKETSEFKHCIEEGYIRFHHNSYIGQKLKELLNAPIMPEHPSDELLKSIDQARFMTGININGNREVYNALRAALTTPPKPKMKTVWKFSYTFTPHNENRVYVTDHSDAEADVRKYHKNVCDNARANKYTNISPIWSEEVEDK